jgi:hypothetical protein
LYKICNQQQLDELKRRVGDNALHYEGSHRSVIRRAATVAVRYVNENVGETICAGTHSGVSMLTEDESFG